jgi:hypothetical protein
MMLVASLAIGMAAFSCDADKSKTAANAPNQAKPAEPAKEAAPAKEAEPAKEATAGEGKVKTVAGAPPDKKDRYTLKVDTPEAKAGAESKVKIRVVPKGKWHMNLDFPTSLKMEAPEDVKLAKANQKKKDAIKLDAGQIEYDVAFTAAQAGEKDFTGKFKFAICIEEACAPVTEKLAFKVTVK